MSLPPWIAGANPRRTALRAVGLVVAAYLTFAYVVLPVRGLGISMEPTIVSGDFMFVSRLTYRFREPRRGDIVAVRLAGPSVVYVKRVLALPGDRLRLDRGVVFVNDQPLDEPYARPSRVWQLDETRLGADEYFVVGDNRSMAMAQHEMGTVPRARLIGPVLFR